VFAIDYASESVPISKERYSRGTRIFTERGEEQRGENEEQDECLRGGKEFKRRPTLRSLSPSVLVMDRLSPGVNSLMPLDNGRREIRTLSADSEYR
jgi:hypothetical protein